MAGVLATRGIRALVFRGSDGRDYPPTSGSSTVWEVRGGEITGHTVHPGDFDLPVATVEALRGSDAQSNADVVRRLLAGEAGPVRDAVVLNAAAGLTALDINHSAPLVERIRANMGLAQESIDSGAAQAALERWVAVTRG